MRTKPLLICGILGSILYLFADVIGGLIWQGYSHASQGVSELMAVGAPSRPLVLSTATTPLYFQEDGRRPPTSEYVRGESN